MRKSLILLVSSALLLGLAACGDSSGQSTLPTSRPTPLPTESVGQAACDIRDRVSDVVSQVQSGAIDTKADVAASLNSLAQQLDTQANRLHTLNFTGAATAVKALSTAASDLADAVEGNDPAALANAAAQAARAIQALPGCPSPTPSASPSS
jgi:hypothetical protein